VDGGLGNHRYPQVGSGDTNANWTTLQWEVTQTLTAANVAIAWTHDLGGFMTEGSGGSDTPQNRLPRDPEMFLRWLQFGALSPLFRTHCSHCEIRPWMYPNFEQLAQAYRLRAELMPLIYSCALEATQTGILCVHPVYYDVPELDEAYQFDQQYMLGSHRLVAPITSAAASNRLSNKTVWLPPGDWVEHATGTMLHAGIHGRTYTQQYNLTQIPIFDRAGSVTPMQQLNADGSEVPNHLVLHVARSVPQARPVVSQLFQDDGQGQVKGWYRLTKLVQHATAAALVLEVDPQSISLSTVPTVPQGEEESFIPQPAGRGYPTEPSQVSYKVVVQGAERSPSGVWLNGVELQHGHDLRGASWSAQNQPGEVLVSLPKMCISQRWTLRVHY